MPVKIFILGAHVRVSTVDMLLTPLSLSLSYYVGQIGQYPGQSDADSGQE